MATCAGAVLPGGAREIRGQGEAAATLSVGELLAGIYDRASEVVSIDYRRPAPDPPLTPEDAAWAEKVLRRHGLGWSKAQFASWEQWAQSCREQGRIGEAIREFSDTVERQPESAAVRFQLGLALWSGDDPRDAIRQLREAVRLDPDHADGCLFLASILQDTGTLSLSRLLASTSTPRRRLWSREPSDHDGL